MTRQDLAAALLAKTLRRYDGGALPLLPWTILRRPLLDRKQYVRHDRQVPAVAGHRQHVLERLLRAGARDHNLQSLADVNMG